MSSKGCDETDTYFNTVQISRGASAIKKTSQSVLSSCRICLSSIVSPAILVCGHRFCETCLDKYWKAKEQPDYVVCPLCREFAAKVGFAKNKIQESTQEFRKRFDAAHKDIPSFTISNIATDVATAVCLKICLLMPIMYAIVQLISPFIRAILYN